MKKLLKMFLLIFILVGLMGCSDPLINASGVELPIAQQPVTVNVAQGTVKNVESLEAKVKRYSSDTRDRMGFKLNEEYRLAIRIIDGKVSTRMDKPGSLYQDLKSRSIFNDGEFVSMVSEGKLLSRTPVPEEVSAANRSAPPLTRGLFQRITTDNVIKEFNRLNYQMEAGKVPSQKVFRVPADVLERQFPGKNIISYKLTIDETAGAMVETEIQMTVTQDEKLIMTSSPLIVVVDGIPVVVGQIESESRTFATRIDTSDNPLPEILPENIPVITQAELEKLEAEGAIIRDVPAPPRPGEKGLRDFTLTNIEVYEDVVLNNTPESYFRTNLWETK